LHCPSLRTVKFQNIINHLIEHHEDEEMKMRKIIENRGKFRMITRNFSGIIPNEVKSINKHIIVESDEFMTISVNDNNRMKSSKISDSTPTKSNKITNEIAIEREYQISNEMTIDDSEITIDSHDNEMVEGPADEPNVVTADIINKLQSMTPIIAEKLAKDGSLSTFNAFLELLMKDEFPLDNIAYRCFLDVVEWLHSDTISQFRYQHLFKAYSYGCMI
ncbi:unnamed protein product, partial [Owenia fusiformis]